MRRGQRHACVGVVLCAVVLSASSAWAQEEDEQAEARVVQKRKYVLGHEFFASAGQSEVAPVVPVAQTQASFFGVYYVGNQYTPANETDLQAPWLYNWLGQPSKTIRSGLTPE